MHNRSLKDVYVFFILSCLAMACRPADTVRPTSNALTSSPGINTTATGATSPRPPDTLNKNSPVRNIISVTSTIQSLDSNQTLEILYNFTTTSTPVQTTSGSNPPMQKTFRILALGDSYTIGESVLEADRHPNQLADTLRGLGFLVSNPKIIARTGWTTRNLLNAIQADSDTTKYDLVLLLIGVNNQYQRRSLAEYRTEFNTCVQTALGFVGNDTNKVVIISIPDYGYTPFGAANRSQISSEIDQFNSVNQQESNLANVHYVFITDISRNLDSRLVASDGLHPSGYQYGLWVDRIVPIVKAIFASNNP